MALTDHSGDDGPGAHDQQKQEERHAALGNGSARACVATGNATGFVVGNGAEIKDSAATANGTGFVASDRSMISNCIATVNTGDGFSSTSYVTIIDCTSGRNFGNGS